jgi:thioredoxin reductase (NADPH)
VAHLTGGASLATAVARGECDVYEVSAEGVREILNRFPDLGDVILQAFIARRHLLRESGTFTSRSCTNTCWLASFRLATPRNPAGR